ncbi:replication factor C subunit 3 [Gigaspora margarita]|uniref:Replication factor C subunit 3 n=1 Tax=Gigaspora margarita TaxID=4874 RepID=A0A8H4AA64_GIGMA|nr:replication factor C subunit 3 [Gigaspora margarita]
MLLLNEYFSINQAPFLWIGFVKSLQATCFDVMKEQGGYTGRQEKKIKQGRNTKGKKQRNINHESNISNSETSYTCKVKSDSDFPHLLIFGSSGAGKKTRILCILNELFGDGAEKIKIDQRSFETQKKN